MGLRQKEDKFKRTGSLNNPPGLLLGAVSKLMSEHELGGVKDTNLYERDGVKISFIATELPKV